MAYSNSLRACLARAADGGLHFLLFLGRRDHGRHAERLDPQLPAPAGRVVQVLVLLLLDLLEGIRERPALISLEGRRRLADQLPVEMVLRLGRDDALGGDELRGIRHTGVERHLHRRHQGLSDVSDDQPSGCLDRRVEIQRLEDPEDDPLVRAGLLEIRLPLFLELFVDHAAEGGLVHLDAALFGLQSLIQQLGELVLVHAASID
jgi:hypothetical protein